MTRFLIKNGTFSLTEKNGVRKKRKNYDKRIRQTLGAPSSALLGICMVLGAGVSIVVMDTFKVFGFNGE